MPRNLFGARIDDSLGARNVCHSVEVGSGGGGIGRLRLDPRPHRLARVQLGFIETDAGVMVIDAMMVSSMVQAYVKALRNVSDKQIRYLVNTHHHLDHCFGNQFYAPAEIVSHRGCRNSMLARGIDVSALQGQWPQDADDWPEIRLTPATLTYED